MTKKPKPLCLRGKKHGICKECCFEQRNGHSLICSKYTEPTLMINNRPLTFEELYKLAESEIKEWKKFLKDIKTMRLKNKKCKKT